MDGTVEVASTVDLGSEFWVDVSLDVLGGDAETFLSLVAALLAEHDPDQLRATLGSVDQASLQSAVRNLQFDLARRPFQPTPCGLKLSEGPGTDSVRVRRWLLPRQKLPAVPDQAQ